MRRRYFRAKISRRSWLLAGLTAPLFRARAAGALIATFDGDNLHVAAPQLHFLTGKPLRSLKDGLTVVYLSRLTIFRDDRSREFRRVQDRLTFSYDVWEEEQQFRATLSAGGRSSSRLSAEAAESWCLENLAISALGLASDRPFWLQFELHVADPRELPSVLGQSGISMTGLIDVFSRKPGADDGPWILEAGPLRLADMPRTSGRGSRNG